MTAHGLTIATAAYDDPYAAKLIGELQQEYVERYGYRDETFVVPTEFAPPMGLFLVAYYDDSAVACGGWRSRGDDAELKRMYVVPRARGFGLARAVLYALESSARSAGRQRIVLETGTEQPEAIALYESSGYTRMANFGRYAGDENTRCYEKCLVAWRS